MAFPEKWTAASPVWLPTLRYSANTYRQLPSSLARLLLRLRLARRVVGSHWSASAVDSGRPYASYLVSPEVTVRSAGLKQQHLGRFS